MSEEEEEGGWGRRRPQIDVERSASTKIAVGESVLKAAVEKESDRTTRRGRGRDRKSDKGTIRGADILYFCGAARAVAY